MASGVSAKTLPYCAAVAVSPAFSAARKTSLGVGSHCLANHRKKRLSTPFQSLF